MPMTFASGQTVTCSPEHPFFVRGKGFVLAGTLNSKDAICGDDGFTTHVVKVSRNSGTSKVYNFAVEGDHTYFVVEGGKSLWVHNTCPLRTDPANLPEQLVKDDAEGGAGKEIMDPADMNDPLYAGTHRKMGLTRKMYNAQGNHVGTIDVHFWENMATGERSGFKFKNAPLPPGLRFK
jgi:hypothetical protein